MGGAGAADQAVDFLEAAVIFVLANTFFFGPRSGAKRSHTAPRGTQKSEFFAEPARSKSSRTGQKHKSCRAGQKSKSCTINQKPKSYRSGQNTARGAPRLAKRDIRILGVLWLRLLATPDGPENSRKHAEHAVKRAPEP